MERLLVSNSELIVTKVDGFNNTRRLKFPERAVSQGCLSDEGTDWQLDISPVFHHPGSDGRKQKRSLLPSASVTTPIDEIVITPAVSLCVATLNKEEPVVEVEEGEECVPADTLIKKEHKEVREEEDDDDVEEGDDKEEHKEKLVKRKLEHRRHSGEQVVYPCKVCGITFSSGDYVEQHSKWCRGSRTRVQRVVSASKQHRHSPASNDNNIADNEGGSDSTEPTAGHQQSSNGGGGEKRYKCGDCDYSTDVSSHLTAHARRHTGERPYACNLCHYRASEACTLTRHKMAHAGHKPYQCPSCQYRASFAGDLAKHIRTHTGEKPFACSVCSYRAARPGSLREHSMTHTGQRPHGCPFCPYRALSKAHLKKHSKTHHHHHHHPNSRRQQEQQGEDEEMYSGFPCYVCGKQDSADLASLTLHIQTQHPHLVSLYDPSS